MDHAATALEVRQFRAETPVGDALAAYERFRARYGPQNVFLLESLGGPGADSRMAVIGLRPLLTLSVRGGAVGFEGAPEVTRVCAANAVAAGAVTGKGPGAATPRLARWNSLWPLLRTVRDGFRLSGDGTVPGFGFGFFGYLGYDTAWSLERLPRLIRGPAAPPEVCLVIHQIVVIVDLERGAATLVVNEGPRLPVVDRGELDEIRDTLGTAARHGGVPAAPPIRGATGGVPREDFLAMVRRAQEYIAAGDVYQVQLGHELTVTTGLDPFDAYLRLRHRNPSPYMYLARLAGLDIVGASPELFVRVEGDTATLRPIAGTVGRGADREDDGKRARSLREDPKERAEHLMLVDLCRNDLGRVCEPGSLRVDEYMVPERYSHLIHLVSNVTARIAPGHDSFDVLAAAFPAGTMTGTPKIRAIEVIEELETTRRGVYAGSIGLIGFGGYVNTALAIRTAVHSGGRYSLRASAGIVADSRPRNEWRETVNKLSAPYWAVTGEELRPEHLGR